jgi:NADH-quinone oxidoreductase subunit L
MSYETLTSLAVFSPLGGFLLALGFQNKHKFANTLSILMMSVSFLAYLILMFTFTLGRRYIIELATWVKVDQLRLFWGFYLDTLTLLMMGVVILVSLLVHIYSLGYMFHDKARGRFMAYLSLFTFMMLMLVTAPNLLQLFFGWEGVGLASYLLIGFWYEKPQASKAAFKAFIVNRVGDVGLALGICACFTVFGSLDFVDIFVELPKYSITSIEYFGSWAHVPTLIALLLFVGAVGKSAQFGLHVWLPDAMEGPTPVSALIHAATMVTAGIFLIARMSPLYEMAPLARDVMVYTGALTAFFAATVALAQNDIKRIIAYSTCSQLGYMVLACGCGAYGAAIFHLMTHAFFKALLFLGAGSVIHAMSDEQDIRKMGGLYNKIPFTYGMMWIGSLALTGVPIFAGYYSKDAIIEAVYLNGYEWVFWVALSATVMTGFYSWRLLLRTFHGNNRSNEHVVAHIHESPSIMLFPLTILALGSVISGYLGYYALMHLRWGFRWGESIALDMETMHVPAWVVVSPLGAAIIGIGLAYLVYSGEKKDLGLRLKIPFLQGFIENKWYVDEFYDRLIVGPLQKLSLVLGQFIDRWIDHYGPDSLYRFALFMGNQARKIQTGYVYHYAMYILWALVILIAGFMMLQLKGF